MNDKKNTVTNIIAIIVVIGGAVGTYLDSVGGDINWLNLGVAVAVAVVAWLTGKTKDGKKKDAVV